MLMCQRAFVLSVGVLAVVGVWPGGEAQAKEEVEIPINVGVGPAVYSFTGVIADNQALHYDC